MFTVNQENSELDSMIDALDRETRETIEEKHEQVDDILNEVHDQVQFLHELHQELGGEE